jgi:hypothetical protein
MKDVDVALYRVRILAVLGLADILVAVVGSNQPQQSVERILTCIYYANQSLAFEYYNIFYNAPLHLLKVILH